MITVNVAAIIKLIRTRSLNVQVKIPFYMLFQIIDQPQTVHNVFLLLKEPALNHKVWT